eukprot:8548247-Ditylum_brightwellii.AAC.1
MNSMTSFQIPSSWTDCPDIIPRDQALEDQKQTKEWRIVETPKEIANYLMLRNKRHFGQAHVTIFTVLLLSHEIDWGSYSIMSELLLEGTYKRSELSHTAKLLQDNCKRETDTLITTEKITKNEWKQRIKVWH